MYRISFLFFLLISIAVKAQKQFINDPYVEVRNISGSFNTISVSNGIDLYISQAQEEAIAVSATKEEYKNKIKTEVGNNELKIYYEGNEWGRNNKKLKVYVSCKNLYKLGVSGSSDVYVAGYITSPSFDLELSGSSDFKGMLKVDKLVINLSGASDALMQGYATNVSVEVSGASDLLAYGLVSDTCVINASGASDVNITVNKELSINASGASDISYKGDAVIKQKQVNSTSSAKKKNK